ncbi:YgiT-type zinc finger protein [Desulforamulus aeronauticus]|uniref:YgiT-type zinc finger domain-containing protein n=1 Tax=Desulforamulus aeronauticus DSM 10349 TaxID=1121421 RepID=A0A1M6SA68_9FIRM|nr:YgiT-type zinc finger protein [Desulforamulus aeronauticus]SHK41664.1 YgiT-type zinc finger domain-containing protein [Desulforamulus aeronauticus DSM 10349]
MIKIEELLRQVIAELQEIKQGQVRLEKTQRNMAKDIKAIKDYQRKGQDVDIERLKERVKKIMEKCVICDGIIEIKNLDFTFSFDRKKYTIPNIRHEVCSQCGEKFIDEETSKFIDKWTEENVYKNHKFNININDVISK